LGCSSRALPAPTGARLTLPRSKTYVLHVDERATAQCERGHVGEFMAEGLVDYDEPDTMKWSCKACYREDRNRVADALARKPVCPRGHGARVMQVVARDGDGLPTRWTCVSCRKEDAA